MCRAIQNVHPQLNTIPARARIFASTRHNNIYNTRPCLFTGKSDISRILGSTRSDCVGLDNRGINHALHTIMNRIELIQTFISILTALAMSDVLLSLHKLLKIRKSVKWHWIPLTWAFIVFGFIINVWFTAQNPMNNSLLDTQAGILLYILPFLFLLLMAMAVLPDSPKNDGFNLLEWYYKSKSYIFSLYLLMFSSASINVIINLVNKNSYISPYLIIPLGIPILASILLIYSKNIWIHSPLTILITIMMFLALVLGDLPE